jgi:hypothetical protein
VCKGAGPFVVCPESDNLVIDSDAMGAQLLDVLPARGVRESYSTSRGQDLASKMPQHRRWLGIEKIRSQLLWVMSRMDSEAQKAACRSYRVSWNEAMMRGEMVMPIESQTALRKEALVARTFSGQMSTPCTGIGYSRVLTRYSPRTNSMSAGSAAIQPYEGASDLLDHCDDEKGEPFICTSQGLRLPECG